MFAIGGLGQSNKPAFTFKVSEHNFNVLKDQPGFRPAPYLASRGMSWIQQYDAPKNTDKELEYYLQESHRLFLWASPKNCKKSLV